MYKVQLYVPKSFGYFFFKCSNDCWSQANKENHFTGIYRLKSVL